MKKEISVFLSAIIVMVISYALYLYSEPDSGTELLNTDNIQSEDVTLNETDLNADALDYAENIPIVHIKGRGYEAGLAHGKLLKKQINEVARILNDDIIYGNKLFGGFLHTILIQKAGQLEAYIPQIYKDEMKGVADGAGVLYSDILLINTYDDLRNIFSCSSIAVAKGEKSDVLIHARNLDYTIGKLAGKNVIFHYEDDGFISVGFPGYIGALSSANDKGLTLSSHTSFIINSGKGVPTGILYRLIMQDAGTIDDAEKILKENKRTIGNNLLVSSLSENRTVVFEITADEILRIEKDNYAVVTNHFSSGDLLKKQIVLPGSAARYEYLEDFYQNTPKIDIGKIKEAMSSFNENSILWSSVANKGTVQSVIFVPETKTVFIARGIETPVTRGGYLKYEYGDLTQY